MLLELKPVGDKLALRDFEYVSSSSVDPELTSVGGVSGRQTRQNNGSAVDSNRAGGGQAGARKAVVGDNRARKSGCSHFLSSHAS